MKEIYRNRDGAIIFDNGYYVVLFRGRHREFNTIREAERFFEEMMYRLEREHQSYDVRTPEQIKQERRGNALDELLT